TVFWLANPYLIVGGNSTPILLPYALLPWTLLALVRAVRSPKSWRWPAAFALGFFAQTGLNAGVVPFFQLVAVPVHLVYAAWVERVRVRDLVRVLVRCGLLTVAVSFYWLVPSLLATGTGSGIAAATESPRDVARPSSFAEATRLLGNWPLYGRSGSRAFLPQDTAFLLNPFVVLATFLLPAGIAASVMRSRARERLLGALLLLVGIPVMVGIFPPDHPPPAGHLLRTIFDHVAASLAFRTTNKVGAVVVLGYAVLLAVGIGTWSRRNRVRSRPRLRAAGLSAAIVVVLGAATLPMWSNGLYTGAYKIPGYWTAATRHLDERDHESRVLVVPGGTGGNYRWGERSPDDLFPSLLARPVAVRNTVVGRGDPAANFLASFDTQLQQGALPAGALSTVARYLGASDVLVRNDLLTEEISGGAPSVVHGQVVADPGLRHDRSFGRRGEHTLPGTATSGSDAGANHAKAAAADPEDAALRPVEIWHVTKPQPVVEASPAATQLLVDGDGEAVSSMAAFGLDDGSHAMRLLGGFDSQDLTTAARDGGRFVLTDTNRRRASDINRVTNATSPTLRANQDIDAGNGATLTLWPDRPSRQSVSEIIGAKAIDATPPAFGLRPAGKPSFAFDGDPSTAWETGELGTAAG
ncbi:MAG TPA: alpha-(1-_3)-arabinofuranosyltransferase family protein, partial [Acidimicrobiales bacterium]